MVRGAVPAGAFGTSEPPPIPSVSAGGYMSCGVQADGTAACWGENGMPSNDTANTSPGGAATPPAGVTFREVNAGYATACGVKTDQTLVCWGSGRFNKHVVPSGTFTHVVPGLNYVCALRTDGTVACWGGDDPAVDPDQKVIRDVPTGQFSQLTVGTRHACALRADGSGTIACWGHNTVRLGVNEGQTNVPPGTYSNVDVSNFTSCALRTDGTPVCWARNLNGQQTYPTDANGNVLTFTRLSTGNAHVCGLRPDKSVVCWGRNSEGQARPVPPGSYTQVTAGTFHTCGMREGESTAVCWGNNMSGRVQPNMSKVAPHQGYAGLSYSFQFTMNPSPIAGAGAIAGISPTPTFSLVEGALPAGLSMTPSGLLSGTPTEAGSYPIKVAASNGLSPPDCVVPVTLAAPNDSQSMPCVPGDTTSVATATRAFTLAISPDAPGMGGVAGQVTTASDGAPVVGATVTLTHSGGSPAGQATTDGDGNYRLGDVAPGDYSVTASGTELQPQSQQVSVAENQTARADFALTPLIRPTVKSVWNNHYQTVTDGVFVEWSEEISPMLGGLDRVARYTVHSDSACSSPAIATGAVSNWLGSRPTIRDLVMSGWENVVEGGAYNLRVDSDTELGMDTQQRNALACVPFVASLNPAHRSTVAGQVTSAATGATISGATVTVTRTVGNPGSVAGQATTDANGNYRVENLAPGPYNVTAAATGHHSKTSGTTATGGATSTTNFALGAVPVAGNDAYTHYGTDTALVVAASGVLANDTDADNDPLTASLVAGPGRGTVTLNPDGSFTYQPKEDFVGTDSFTYKVNDGTGDSNVGTVILTVGAGCRGSAATIVGTSGADRLTGTSRPDVIAGLGGDDMVIGQAGDDVVCGGSGKDTLSANAGNDYVDGGSQDDTLRGGDGDDTVTGGNGADSVKGDEGSDVLSGGAGATDACNGGNGTDSLAPNHGCETVKEIP
ncbi:MAG: carboxypeptidase regulatory-like domain-containing protein [Actinomycetota bacterium]|nr:carboxypeptidase regulatory-like domain-containing protein [Actinomycetota bacterium]